MSRASVLARAQAAAARGMVDVCTIRRPTGGGTTDPITGYPTQVYATVYAGVCRVQQQVAVARPHEVGEDRVLIVRFVLQLPVSAVGLQVDDEVTLTASVNDPDLVGRVFEVNELMHKSEPTARRVGIIERTG